MHLTRMIVGMALAALLAGCDTGPGNEAAPDLYRGIVLRTVSVERLSTDGSTGELFNVPADGFGSGVLLSPIRVLTAAHVVEGAKTLRVQIPLVLGNPNEIVVEVMPARVIALDKEKDLALLEIKSSSNLPEAPLAAEPLREDEQVYVFDACPQPHNVAHGRSLNPLQINVSGQPGSSGAGVWVFRNWRFELAGMVVSRIAREPVVTNVWSRQTGNNRVNVNIVKEQPRITNIVPANLIMGLLQPQKQAAPAKKNVRAPGDSNPPGKAPLVPGTVLATEPLSISIERSTGYIHFNATEEQQRALNAKYVEFYVVHGKDKQMTQQGWSGTLEMPWSLRVRKSIRETENFPIQIMGKTQDGKWEVVLETE